MSIEALPLVEVDDAPPRTRIVKAGVIVGTAVFTGWRHADIMAHLIARRMTEFIDDTCMGFVDEHGNFWSRYQASKIAILAR